MMLSSIIHPTKHIFVIYIYMKRVILIPSTCRWFNYTFDVWDQMSGTIEAGVKGAGEGSQRIWGDRNIKYVIIHNVIGVLRLDRKMVI